MRRACVLAVALVATSPVLAGDVPVLDGAISDVLSGGTLERDYRIVVACRAFEHVSCDVWAQWLAHDGETSTRVAQTVPIAELNGRGYAITRLERLHRGGLQVVAGDVRSSLDPSASGRFELELEGAGHYVFRWLRDPSQREP